MWSLAHIVFIYLFIFLFVFATSVSLLYSAIPLQILHASSAKNPIIFDTYFNLPMFPCFFCICSGLQSQNIQTLTKKNISNAVKIVPVVKLSCYIFFILFKCLHINHFWLMVNAADFAHKLRGKYHWYAQLHYSSHQHSHHPNLVIKPTCPLQTHRPPQLWYISHILDQNSPKT